MMPKCEAARLTLKRTYEFLGGDVASGTRRIRHSRQHFILVGASKVAGEGFIN